MAFATVNVIFKDRIIASKDHRYQQMQSAYENRIADLQQSYDELNGALVSAEDRFKSKADELEAKQETVSRLLNRKQAVDSIVGGPARQQPGSRRPMRSLRDMAPIAHAGGPGFRATAWASDTAPAIGGGSATRPSCRRIPSRSRAPAGRPRRAFSMKP